MRSPHTPQPNVNLAEDADPASELGPRLAAASQTVQGLLTNYLFYGQRRAHTTTGPDAHALRERQSIDASEERGRGTLSGAATLSAGVEHTRTRTPVPRQRTATPAGGADLGEAGAAMTGTPDGPRDPLAVDGLTVDGMRYGTLTLIAAEDSARLQPPTRS